MSTSKQNDEITMFNSGSFDDCQELDRLFPNPADSFKGSVSFAKNFTLLALSVISYSRGMFPIHAYSDKTFKGHLIQILIGRGACKEANLVWKWLRSACKALDKGYMKELIFEVLSVDDTVVEYYTVEYRYEENDIKCRINATDTKIAEFDRASFQATFMNLLASITSFMKELDPLPEAYKLQLRITYYEARTPDNYIPDYFRDEPFDYKAHKGLLVNLMGAMSTPFHDITVRMASSLKRKLSTLELQQTRMSQEETQQNIKNINSGRADPNMSTNVRVLEYQTPIQLQYSKELTQEGTSNDQNKIQATTGPSSSAHTKSTTLKKSSSQENYFTKIVHMNCICDMNDNNRAVFECFHCQKWHHLVCYKKKPTYTINPTQKYSCVKCALDDGTSDCLDPTLATKSVPIKIIEDLAVYRQVIFRLQWFTIVNLNTLMRDFRISEELGRSIISKLVRRNILRPCTRSGDYTLNTNQLVAFVNTYFK